MRPRHVVAFWRGRSPSSGFAIASRGIAVLDAFRDRAGNVSMMFGVMLLPILLSIGGAVDFGRWLLARQQTISALDAAALAGARALQVEDASTAAAILMAQAMYKENTKKRLPLKSDTIVFNVGADKASIEVTGKATLQTYFLISGEYHGIAALEHDRNGISRGRRGRRQIRADRMSKSR